MLLFLRSGIPVFQQENTAVTLQGWSSASVSWSSAPSDVTAVLSPHSHPPGSALPCVDQRGQHIAPAA